MARTVAVVLGLGMLAGCSSLPKDQQNLLREGQQAYEQGRRSKDQRQYQRAIEHLTLFVAQAHEQPEVARALYIRAMCYAQAGRRADAYDDLRRSAELATDADVVWRIYAVLGTLHFEESSWDLAGRAYSTAVKKMPPTPPMDTILDRLGRCYERTGRWSAAQRTYRHLVSRFPSSRWADRARRLVSLNAGHFAVQAGAFSVRKNAENLVAQLQRQGLEAYVRREPRKYKTMYVVLVGRFGSYEQAQRYLADVKAVAPDAVMWP